MQDEVVMIVMIYSLRGVIVGWCHTGVTIGGSVGDGHKIVAFWQQMDETKRGEAGVREPAEAEVIRGC